MKNKTTCSNLFPLFAFLLLFASCGQSGPKEPTDTPTSGSVKIVSDESFSLLFETMEYTFESLYTNAQLNISFKAETEALQDLINDSCKVVVMTRDLTPTEKKRFNDSNIYPKSTKIAEDAIALIVHNESPDTMLSLEQLRGILLGHDTAWSQVNRKSSNEKIHVVFDNPNSTNARFLRDSLIEGNPFPANVFAVKSNPEVINYVSGHRNTLGVISVNWISDMDDTITKGFLKKVKVVALAKGKADTASMYFKPYQAYIKTKDYPLTRDVYMVNRQSRAGLGTGFVSFVAGEKGQRMILKAGLIPSTMPVRIVKFN